jgi:TPR repeat protein
MRIFTFLLAAAILSPPLAAQSVKSGIEAWQEGNAEAAVAIWRPLADKGDPDAAYNLGQAYRLGKGVNLDLAQAQIFYERAAAKGHVDAQATLGLLLFRNGNRIAAARWLKPAAEAGEPRALLLYGAALINGDGVTPDPVTGYAYVSRSAAQGFAPAKSTLADLDAVLPLEQRQKGVELAQRLAKPQGKGKPDPLAPAPSGKTAVAAPRPAVAVPPKPAAAVARPLATAPARGNWRIQLGAFGQRSSAEALYKRLGAKLAGRQAYYIPVGALTRLQVGPFESRGAAAAACSSLGGQSCFAVETR